MSSEKQEDTLREIDKKIFDDGLQRTCSHNDKLLHLWNCLRKMEEDLQKAMENETKLKTEQEVEMKDVEKYVEHIRHLSDEREQLIQELELENETLKNEKQNSAGSDTMLPDNDTKEMLRQQGLVEMANKTVNEQIAFLLLERARLLDELESEQHQPTSSDAETTEELRQILNRERKSFDRELEQHRASTTMIEEKLKNEHEEEINCLMDENAQLEDDLADEQEKMKQLTREIEKLKYELETAKTKVKDEKEKEDSPRVPITRPPSPARTSSDLQLRKIIEEKTKLEGELISLRSQIRVLEDEKREKESDLSSMQTEVERMKQENERFQVKNQRLKSDLKDTETQLDAAENNVEKLTQSKESLNMKLIDMEAKLKTLQDDARKDFMLQETVELLNVSKKQMKDEIENLNKRLAEAMSTEEEIASEKMELTSKQEELNAQIKTLSNELESIKSERELLEEVNMELKNFQVKQKNLSMKLKEEVDNLVTTKDKLLEEKNKLLEEHKNHLNSVEVKNEQESMKKELIIQHMRDQNQKLTSQVDKLQTGLLNLEEKESSIMKKKESIEMFSIEVQQQHDRELEYLKSQLQLFLEELSESKNVAEQMNQKNEELVKQLSQVKKQEQTFSLTNQNSQNTPEKICDLELIVTELKQRLEESELEVDNYKKEQINLEKTMCEFSDLETEIFTVREDYENLKREKILSDEKCREFEEWFEDQKLEQESVQQNFNAKIQSLEKRNEELEEELFNIQEELESSNSKADVSNKELMILKENAGDTSSIKPCSGVEFYSAIPVTTNGKIDIHKNKKESDSPVCQSPENKNSSTSFNGRIEAVTDELSTSKNQLESTMKEVEVYKSKLEQLKQELDCSNEQLDKSRSIVESLQAWNEQLQFQKEQLQSQKGQLQELLTMNKDETDDGGKCMEEKTADPHTLELTLGLQQAEVELCNAKVELDDTKRELIQTKAKLELVEMEKDLKQTTNSSAESQLSKLTRNLQQIEIESDNRHIALDAANCELSETKAKLKHLETHYSVLKNSMEQEHEKLELSEKDRRLHLDRIQALEDISRQLEMDNREMAKKLSETLTEIEELKIKLERERQRNSENDNLVTQHSRQLEEELDAATKQIKTLREELHWEQAKVFRLEADNVGQKAKYDSIVTRLETEVADLKEFHHKEMLKVTNKLEDSGKEIEELRVQLREKEQDLLNHENETARIKSSLERMEAQVETEIKLKTTVENRNKQQEEEMKKVWVQVQTMMVKCSKLENTKHCLEEELSRLMSATRQAETIFVQKSAIKEATITSLENRAEQAEGKSEKLQRELDEVYSNLKNMEHKVYDTECNHIELEEKKDIIVRLRNQLESEKLQRTLLDQTVAELKHQVSMLKQRESKVSTENRDHQHTILDLESQLTQLKEEKVSEFDQSQISENGKHNLMEQIVRLRREVSELQYELLSANEKQEKQEKRYADRKLRTKEKLLKAREFYSSERSRLNDEMQVMNTELRMARATLIKEAQWREKIDTDYKHILKERRELITKLTEQEETLRDRSRSLNLIQVRLNFIEEENARLQTHIEALNNQSLGVEKSIKTTKKSDEVSVEEHEDHRDESDVEEPDHIGDGSIKIINRSPRLGKYVGAVVNLYQNDTDTEGSGNEFDV